MKRALLFFILILVSCAEVYAWRYENKNWKFRIDELDDKTIVDESKWYKVFTRDKERVDILLFYTKSEVEWEDLNAGERAMSNQGMVEYTNRYTYHFLRKLDSIYLTIDSTYKLVYEKRKPFSCKLTRIYESPTGHKVKTVGYYSKNVLYYFVGGYTDKPALFDHLIHNFKSSLTNSAEGLFSIWQDKISGEKGKGFRAVSGKFIGFMLKALWPALIIVICVTLIVSFFSARSYFLGTIFAIISLFAISFLCCHELFMNWIMGYGPLWKVLLSVVIAVAQIFSS